LKFLIPLICSCAFALALPADALADSQPAPAATVSPSPAPSPSPTATPKAFQVSGFGDVGVVSSSIAAPNGSITGRVFDNLDRRPQFHTLSLTAAYTGPVGGKLELNMGDDADVIASYPKFGGVGTIDITQAYASLTQGKFTLIGGKFETLAGAEVIESPSNVNFSRSILFGYAVPFTHTGARLTYAASDKVSLIAGLNKGWDTTKTVTSNDNNRLTTELGLSLTPSAAFSFTAQAYTGIVEAFDPLANQRRSLIDLVGTYHFNDKLTGIVNYDSGRQTNSTLVDSFGVAQPALGTATWTGLAGYISYALTPKVTGTLRGEYFNDANGSRTGLSQHWSEATLTGAYALTPNVTFRLEGRKDHANSLYFATSEIDPKTGGYRTRSYLDTIGAEFLVKFP